ncbi:pentapeptide repeat-containing protein, partial [Sinorhizobium meliloti]
MKKLGMTTNSSGGAAFFAVAITVSALASSAAVAADCKSSARAGIDSQDCNKKQIML